MLLKTQDVPLDGTIFFGNTGQKDKATSMNHEEPHAVKFLSRNLIS